MTEALTTWIELLELQSRYMSALDSDELEAWPTFFVEDCRYEIISKENVDAGLPAPVIYCKNNMMLRDRVLSLREANIFAEHTYRHAASGFVIRDTRDGVVYATSSYSVVITDQEGHSQIYQAGRYEDQCVKTENGWRYKSKRVVYDTLRVQTLLATPI